MLGRLLKRGELTVIGPGGDTHRYGQPHPDLKPVIVRLTDRKVALEIARDPAIGAVEAWMDDRMQLVDCEIIDLMVLVRANQVWEELDRRDPFLQSTGRLLHFWRTFNRKKNSRRNVEHHYDVGNEVYRLFLDPDLQYSCGYFTDPGNSIEQAQLDKKAHIASKLHLQAGQRVLDIGCGWGGLALYLNRVADVDVLGITLSKEQLSVARQRAADAGVADRVKFELMDYRDVEGQYDRVVSIGMFEHLGTAFFQTFFARLKSLLKPDGVSLIHTMGRMDGPGTTDNFMEKYIFPGGYLPALSEIVAASEKERLIMADCETLRLHYVYTLRAWYDRFKANHAEIVRLKDERFWRLYAFYLSASMTMFSDAGNVVYQLQYLRSRHATPITRNYMIAVEDRYMAPETPLPHPGFMLQDNAALAVPAPDPMPAR